MRKYRGWRAVRMFGGRLMFTMLTNELVGPELIKGRFSFGWTGIAARFGNTLYMLYIPVKVVQS